MQAHENRSSLLFPSAASRFSPSEQNYSPLAQFSSQTLQEHETIVRNLREHQEHVIVVSAQLATQEAEESRRHHAAMSALAREEAEVLHQLASNKKFRESLEHRSAEEATRRKESIDVERDEKAGLEEEEASLRDLEGDLRAMLAEMERKMEEVRERTRLYRSENERSMSVLQHDQHEAHVLATATTYRRQAAAATLGGSPARTATPFGLNRDAPSLPHQQTRPQSPPSASYQQQRQQQRTTSPARVEVVRGALRQMSTAGGTRAAHVERATVSPPRAPGTASSYSTLVAAPPLSRRAASPPPPPVAASAAGAHTPLRNASVDYGSSGVMVSPTRAGRSNRELQDSQGTFTMSAIHDRALAQGQPASPPSAHERRQQHRPQHRDQTEMIVAAMGSPSHCQASTTGAGPGAVSSQDPATRLHELCSGVVASSPSSSSALRGQPTVDDVLHFIRLHPDAVNHLDDLGNTPLHCACAVQNPSLEVVHALLLAGTNAGVLNADGMAPLHIACLNDSDTSHKLKKFLIFKAAQNPNLRTGRGETAAHLVCVDDRHLETLKFLATVGVDMNASALLADADGASRRMTPLDRARSVGVRAAKCRTFLETLL